MEDPKGVVVWKRPSTRTVTWRAASYAMACWKRALGAAAGVSDVQVVPSHSQVEEHADPSRCIVDHRPAQLRSGYGRRLDPIETVPFHGRGHGFRRGQSTKAHHPLARGIVGNRWDFAANEINVVGIDNVDGTITGLAAPCNAAGGEEQ